MKEYSHDRTADTTKSKFTVLKSPDSNNPNRLYYSTC